MDGDEHPVDWGDIIVHRLAPEESRLRMNTKWQGLWAQERTGFYAGQVIKKADIPKYTRIVLRYNKYYEKDGNRPRFVYCFADSEGYQSKCKELRLDDNQPYKDDDCYYDGEGNRLYTSDEVYRIIHGMEEYYNLSWGNNLIEDYI